MKFFEINNEYKNISFNIQILFGILEFFFLIVCLFLYNGPTGYSGDGAFQYAQLLSVMQDFDLNLNNNFHPSLSHHIGDINYFSFGPAILWTPFYLVGLLIKVIFYNNQGQPYIYYTPFSNLGTIFYAYCGLKLTQKAFTEYFKIEKTLFIEFFVLFCTPLLFYVFRDPQMSHALGFFSVALLLYAWTKTYNKKINHKKLFFIALAIGFTGCVRFQSIVCGIIFVPQFLSVFKNGTQFNFLKKIKLGFVSCLTGGSGMLLGGLPQLIAWKIQFGSFFAFPHQGVFNYVRPNFYEVWFGVHGLFIWHPFLAVCVLGLFIMLIKKETRNTAVLFLIALLAQSYICALPTDPGASCSFGMRRLTEYIGIMAFGFGPFFTLIKPKRRLLTSSALWLLCLIFGCINLCYFTIAGFPYGDPNLRCTQDPQLLKWIFSVLMNTNSILQKTFIPAFGSMKMQILLLLFLLIPMANAIFFKGSAATPTPEDQRCNHER
jgi:hypothetical protein